MSLSRFLLLGVWLAILLIRCWFYLLNQQLWRILRVFQNLLKPPGWVIWLVLGIKLLRILFWRNCKRFVVCLFHFHGFNCFKMLLRCFFYWVNCFNIVLWCEKVWFGIFLLQLDFSFLLYNFFVFSVTCIVKWLSKYLVLWFSNSFFKFNLMHRQCKTVLRCHLMLPHHLVKFIFETLSH